MWIREESAPSSVLHALIEKEGNGQATGYYALILGQKIRVHFYDASANNSGWDSTNNVITSQDGTTWYHVAAAVDVSGPSIAMYINGSSVATTAIGSQTATSVGANAYPFTIGEFRATADRGFDGLIDEVRVWNDIRTPTEISDNYEKELAGTEANLVGYWKFNNDGTDSQTSGNNDLTNNNTATFSTTVPFAGESTTVDADNSQVISFF